MSKKNKRNFCAAAAWIAAFVLWTAGVCLIDVRGIGPGGSKVGFASINAFFHGLTGVHMALYTITDWLGLVPVAFGLGFALLGLAQLIRRRSLRKVDFNLLVLGGFYIIVLAAYLLFEEFVVNYRPVLINGYLEASYPSSTTMLVMCVMPTAMIELKKRIKNDAFRRCVSALISGFIVFMVAGRLISGVHWLSDVIGGALLSAGLVKLYAAVCKLEKK